MNLIGTRSRSVYLAAAALGSLAILGSSQLPREARPGIGLDRGGRLVADGGTAEARPELPAPPPRHELPPPTWSDVPQAQTAALAATARAANRRSAWNDLLGYDDGDPEWVTNEDGRMLAALSAGRLQASDLRALQDLISLNGLDEQSSPYDRNDGDGVLSVWELGFQIWRAGRLVAFSLGPDPHTSFEYEVAELPASFEDLDALRFLGLQHNRLRQLPEGIGELAELEQLIASNNQLSALPESIGGMRSLERLVLSHNQLESLPESMGRLEALTALHLANNRLGSLPDQMSRLENLRVLDLSQSPEQAATGGSQPLPWSPSELSSLEEIYLAGHPSLCGPFGAGGSPISQRDGSTLRVYGAHSAACVR